MENPPTEPEPGNPSAGGGVPVPPEDPGEWFRAAFDELYGEVYAHRDESEARLLIRTLSERHGLEGPALDLGCGAGRLLRTLAAERIESVGLDLSLPLLRQARVGSPVPRLLRADMRAIPLRARSCAWVLSLFTSFGYFSCAEEDRAVLEEVARVLRPRGSFVLDFLNARQVESNLVPDSRREVRGRIIRETRWIDATGPFLRKQVAIDGRPGEPPLVYGERVRLYTPRQLEDLLHLTGLAPMERWGGYDGGGFAEDSPRCLILARKEGR